jgi:trehalose 6-phosphate synthase
MSDLVVAANRGPFSLVEGRDGDLVAKPGGGGLAPSLASALSRHAGEATWVASAMSPAEQKAARSGAIDTGNKSLGLRLVPLEEQTYRAAYDVVANATLWFCFHGLFDASRRPLFDRRWHEAWEGFVAYNAAFAEEISDAASEAAVVLVNDYHLPLVGRMLADERPDLSTVHFTHTPFSEPFELAMLPREIRRQLMEGMAGFGACGFHTARWEEAFSRSSTAVIGHSPLSFHCGLGADLPRLKEVASSPRCVRAGQDLQELVGDRAVVMRSDRIELSKNILRGFHAFSLLLEERADLRGRVCFVARAYASRQGLSEYLAYRSEAEHLVEVLNERWAPLCGGEPPIIFQVDDDFPATVAAFKAYDVLLVNPLRDGMNLVAKEGPALNERHGVLVLSEQAGAYEEMSEAVIGVQPFDVSETAAALAKALDMGQDERRQAARALFDLATACPPDEWLDALLAQARPPRELSGA